MYKNAPFLIIGLIIISFLHINASYKEQKSKQIDKIIVGSGGGFTGITKEYIIHKDGTVQFQQGNQKEATPFGKISKKEFHEIAKKTEAAGFQSIDLNEAGNFYYYIEITQKGKSHKVTWTNQGKESSIKMQELYTYIMDMISKSKDTK